MFVFVFFKFPPRNGFRFKGSKQVLREVCTGRFRAKSGFEVKDPGGAKLPSKGFKRL